MLLSATEFCIFAYFLVMRLSCCFFYFFFFSSRRRHTRSLRDWSSDVCSSDLGGETFAVPQQALSIAGSEWSLLPPDVLEIVSRIAREHPPLQESLHRRPVMRSEERRVGKECRSRWWAGD